LLLLGPDGTNSNPPSDDYFDKPLIPRPGTFKGWTYPLRGNCWEPIGIYNGLYPNNKIIKSGCLGFHTVNEYTGLFIPSIR